jgi:hypothetical protein
MGMRRTVLLLASTVLAVLLAGGVALLAVPEEAQAAFPGDNGRIFFTKSDQDHTRYEMWSITPEGTGERRFADYDDADRFNYPGSGDFGTSVSADGTKVAFYRSW